MAEKQPTNSLKILAAINAGTFNTTFHNDGTDKSADAKAMANASAAAEQRKEQARLVLRGYPLLKGKTTLEITGVGKGSGKWYCKTVVQQWHVDHGYLTTAQLTKGEGDDGSKDPGGSKPVTPPPAP